MPGTPEIPRNGIDPKVESELRILLDAVAQKAWKESKRHPHHPSCTVTMTIVHDEVIFSVKAVQ